MIKKADWLAIAKDRTAVMLLLGLAVCCVVLIATVIIRLHPSDIQIPVRYTGFGQTFIYRDQWYTQYSYVGFAVIITAVNGFLALRLYQLKRMLGLGLLGMSIFVVILATIVINAMFNLAPSL
jgi:hypothetical protein